MTVEDRIRHKLIEAFHPAVVSVTNDSAKHAGHAGAHHPGAVPGQTHFTVTVVSTAFEGLSRLERHRQVNEVLKEELNGPVHALAIVAKTPQEAGQ